MMSSVQKHAIYSPSGMGAQASTQKLYKELGRLKHWAGVSLPYDEQV